MSTTTPARLRAALVAALAIAALGAGASSASAAQSISIGDTVVQEGSHGAGGTATFTITDRYDYGETPSYDYTVQTSSETAAPTDDYVETSDSASSTGLVPCANPAGCTAESTFTVPVVGDDVAEGNESFFAFIGSSLPVTNARARATIVDDDAASAPSPAPAPAPVTVSSPVPAASQPATTAPAPLADEIGPAMGMVYRGMRTRALVRLRCPDDEISCTGRLFVRLNGANLGMARFDLDGGESRLVAVRLTRAERSKLRRAGVLYAKAIAFDAASNRQVRELLFQL